RLVQIADYVEWKFQFCNAVHHADQAVCSADKKTITRGQQSRNCTRGYPRNCYKQRTMFGTLVQTKKAYVRTGVQHSVLSSQGVNVAIQSRRGIEACQIQLQPRQAVIERQPEAALAVCVKRCDARRVQSLVLADHVLQTALRTQ